MRRIPTGDFKLGEEEKLAIKEVMDSGRISEGAKVKDFENAWANYIGTKFAVLTNSGTSALIVGLTALKYVKGVKEGSKVITSPLTYIADANAIIAAKLEPVFVDIDPVTFCIDTKKVRELLENSNPEEYSVIMPIHLLGYSADMDEITKIAEEHNLIVFEDAAQAHGSLYRGKRVGSLSSLAIYSFYIAHNIQAGELGAVVTDDPEIARAVKKLKANGRACDCEFCTRSKGFCRRLSNYEGEDDYEPRFSHDMIGFNFKTMEFQAALALSQVRKADMILQRRQNNVNFLNRHLAKFSDYLRLPLYSTDVSYLAYPLVVKPGSRYTRKHLRKELEKRGVETRPIFGSIPTQQPAYAHMKDKYEGKLPNADYIGLNGFYIGCHQFLNEEDLAYVVKCFEEIFQ